MAHKGTVHEQEIDAAAKKYRIPPKIFRRLVRQESGGRINVGSPAGARGPAQLMPGTAAGLGVDINDWKQNLEGGAKYLRQQLDTFGGDMRKALAAYNAGPGAVKKYGGVPPYKETQNYVASILAGVGNIRDKGGQRASTRRGRQQTTTTVPGMAPLTIESRAPDTTADRVQAATEFLQRGDAAAFAAADRELDAVEGQAAAGITLPGVPDTQVTRGRQAPGAGGVRMGGPGAKEGGGWGGAEGVVTSVARRYGRKYGAATPTGKRDPATNARIGGSATSDHLTTKKAAYAEDYGITGEAGFEMARRIAEDYGIPFKRNAISEGVKKINGRRYKIQVIFGPAVGHDDHVHVGAQLVG